MIFDAIIQVLLFVLEGVLSLIPEYELNIGGLGAGLGSALNGANSVFPIVTLGLCIAAVVGLRLFLALVALIAWVWAKVPFTFK